MNRAIVAAACLLATATAAQALDPARQPGDYVQRVWTRSDGLGGDDIAEIVVAADGALWLATRRGVARFDGAAFEHITTPALPSNLVSALATDARGVWIGMYGGGLLVHADGALVRIDLGAEPAARKIQALAVAADGTVWVGTDGGGLAAVRDDRAYWLPAFAGARIRALHVDASGALWVASAGGVARVVGDQATPLQTPAEVGAFAEHDGVVWIAHRGGVSRWRDGAFDAIAGLPPARLLRFDRHGNLWIATSSGLLRWRDGQTDGFAAGALASDRIRALRETPDGSLWVGTERHGLVRLADGTFRTYGAAAGLASTWIWSVAAARDGAIWIGTSGAGVARYERGAIRHVDGLAGTTAYAVLEDRAGTLWVGTDRGLVRRDGDRFVPAGLAGAHVVALFEDRAGALWVGTKGSGMARVANGVLVAYDAGLPSRDVLAFAEDARGRLWIGCNGGLAVADAGGLQTFTAREGFTADIVTTLVIAPDGALYIGTADGGLVRHRDGRFDRVLAEPIAQLFAEPEALWVSGERVTRYPWVALDDPARRGAISFDEFDGLRRAPGGPAQPSMLRAANSTLWMATLDGLATVDPRELRARFAPAAQVTAFAADDEPARSPLDHDVRRIELGFAAIDLVDGDRLRFAVRLDGFDDRWRETTRRDVTYTSLPPGAYRFRVAAIARDGARGPEATLRFTVEPAIYQRPWFIALAIACALAAIAAVFALRVRALRRRARELTALVAERTQELDRQNRELDAALARLRDTQAELVRTERMASVATLVRGIAHELNNPIGFIAGNVDHLRRYSEFLVRIATALRDGRARSPDELAALLQLTPKKDLDAVTRDLASILDDVSEGARRARLIIADLQSLTAGSQRGLEAVSLPKVVEQTLALLAPQLDGIDVRTELADVPPITARAGQLEQVTTNLVHNATQAVARGGTIRIAVRGIDDAVELVVADDGAGMTPEVQQRAFEPFFTTRAAGEGSGLGLSIVASIVAGHRGTIAVDSAPGRGTTVTVRIPYSGERSA